MEMSSRDRPTSCTASSYTPSYKPQFDGTDYWAIFKKMGNNSRKYDDDDDLHPTPSVTKVTTDIQSDAINLKQPASQSGIKPKSNIEAVTLCQNASNNGRRIPGGTKKKVTSTNVEKAARNVYFENQRLQLETIDLKFKIQRIRDESRKECTQLLNAAKIYCERKAEKGDLTCIERLPELRQCKPSRVAAGCSRGGCGGYTPSGWNKLKTLREMECCCPLVCADDPCCPLPPEAGPCPTSTKAKSVNFKTCDTTSCHAGVADCNNRPSVRILGELAFQLERRILDYLYGNEKSKQSRVYGYTVSSVCLMLEREMACPCPSMCKKEMHCRLTKILCGLTKCGYDIHCHGIFAQQIINKYGVLPSPPSQCTIQMFGLNDACAIACLITKLSQSPDETHNLNILLNSLLWLSKADGRALFVW